jgi:hypothetical protein
LMGCRKIGNPQSQIANRSNRESAVTNRQSSI